MVCLFTERVKLVFVSLSPHRRVIDTRLRNGSYFFDSQNEALIVKNMTMAKNSELDRLVSELSKYDFKDIQTAGWHFQPNDYYSLLNDVEFLISLYICSPFGAPASVWKR